MDDDIKITRRLNGDIPPPAWVTNPPAHEAPEKHIAISMVTPGTFEFWTNFEDMRLVKAMLESSLRMANQELKRRGEG